MLVAVTAVVLISHVVAATATENYGGCGCSTNRDGVTKCVGVNDNVFNITSSESVRNLTIDCIGRSQIKSLQRNAFKAGVDKLDSLEILSCDMETIGQNAFDELTALERLSLRNNSLRNISDDAFLISGREKTSSMRDLDLSYNKLQDLSQAAFLRLVSLSHISLRGNHIEDLDDYLFFPTLALKTLDLGENRLKGINGIVFRELTDLKSLLLDNNLLTSIPGPILRAENGLEDLKLSGNSITALDSICLNLGRLTSLDLGNNQLTSITSGTFQDCGSLKYLFLQQNMITDLSSDAFRGMDNLETLSLSGNKLIVLHDMTFSTSPSMTTLELQENNIQRLSGKPFQDLTHLLLLNLSGNSLEAINGSGTLGGLGRLQTLDISDNPKLATIHPEALIDSGLIDLDASRCSLQSVDFLRLPGHLGGTVDLSQQNQALLIPEAVFMNVGPIQRLILSDNKLRSIDFLDQTAVTILDLDNTDIKDHLSGHFVNSSSPYHKTVRHLSIRRNKIDSVEEIRPLLSKSIQTLDLSENKLLQLTLPSTTQVPLENLQTLIVDHNQAAGSLQISISTGFATTVHYSGTGTKLSLFGTRFSGFESLNMPFTNLHLGGTGGTVLMSDWSVVSPSSGETSLSITHAGLVSVPLLGRAPWAWMEIILNNNKLTKIYHADFSMNDVGNLRKLDLSHNHIYWIDTRAFYLPGLRDLDLSYNYISSVTDITSWFSQALPALTTIDLTFNKMQTLPKTQNDTLFSEAQDIRLGFNPYHCNCELHWLTPVVCDSMKTDGYIMGGGCVTPKSIPFAEILPSDINEQCVSPRIEKMESHELSDGNTLLTCVASGDPLPSVYWSRIHANSEQVLLVTAEPSRDKASSWTVATVLLSHEGTDFVNYACKANTSMAPSGVSQPFVPTTTPIPETTAESMTSNITLVAGEGGDSDKKYTAGDMAGAVLGTLIICLLLVGLACFVFWKMRQKSKRQASLERDMKTQPSPEEILEMENETYDFTDENTNKGFSFTESLRRFDPRKLIARIHRPPSAISETSSCGPPETAPPPPPRGESKDEPPPIPGRLRPSARNNEESDEQTYDDTTAPVDEYWHLEKGSFNVETYDCLEESPAVGTTDMALTPVSEKVKDKGRKADGREEEDDYKGKKEEERPVSDDISLSPDNIEPEDFYEDVESVRRGEVSKAGDTTVSDKENDETLQEPSRSHVPDRPPTGKPPALPESSYQRESSEDREQSPDKKNGNRTDDKEEEQPTYDNTTQELDDLAPEESYEDVLINPVAVFQPEGSKDGDAAASDKEEDQEMLYENNDDTSQAASPSMPDFHSTSLSGQPSAVSEKSPRRESMDSDSGLEEINIYEDFDKLFKVAKDGSDC